MFAGVGWGGSEGQQIMYTGLALPIFFRKGWGGFHLFGICALNLSPYAAGDLFGHTK